MVSARKRAAVPPRRSRARALVARKREKRAASFATRTHLLVPSASSALAAAPGAAGVGKEAARVPAGGPLLHLGSAGGSPVGDELRARRDERAPPARAREKKQKAAQLSRGSRDDSARSEARRRGRRARMNSHASGVSRDFREARNFDTMTPPVATRLRLHHGSRLKGSAVHAESESSRPRNRGGRISLRLEFRDPIQRILRFRVSGENETCFSARHVFSFLLCDVSFIIRRRTKKNVYVQST